MTAPGCPAGVAMGAVWTAKRGRRVPDVEIRNIYRPDRAVLVYDAHGRSVVRWSDLRKNWRPL